MAAADEGGGDVSRRGMADGGGRSVGGSEGGRDFEGSPESCHRLGHGMHVHMHTRMLIERTQGDGAAANDPPPGWGLAVPWVWRKGGGAAGRCSHVAVDPVQLFWGLHQRRVAEAVADAGDIGCSAAASLESSPADGGDSGGPSKAVINRSDFERFGGELLQVCGVPELPVLWRCLQAMQQRDRKSVV